MNVHIRGDLRFPAYPIGSCPTSHSEGTATDGDRRFDRSILSNCFNGGDLNRTTISQTNG